MPCHPRKSHKQPIVDEIDETVTPDACGDDGDDEMPCRDSQFNEDAPQLLGNYPVEMYEQPSDMHSQQPLGHQQSVDVPNNIQNFDLSCEVRGFFKIICEYRIKCYRNLPPRIANDNRTRNR